MTDLAAHTVILLPGFLLFLAISRTLLLAAGASLLLHLAVALGVRFCLPDPRAWLATARLDVVLVNSRHSEAPKKADALAQVNMNGAGTPSTWPARAHAAAGHLGAARSQPAKRGAKPAPVGGAHAAQRKRSDFRRQEPAGARRRLPADSAAPGQGPTTDLLAQVREIARLEGEIAENQRAAIATAPRRFWRYAPANTVLPAMWKTGG